VSTAGGLLLLVLTADRKATPIRVHGSANHNIASLAGLLLLTWAMT
jgi:hypothetical protein